MKIISSVEEIKKTSKEFRNLYPHKKLGFVPTMGAIHEGHISLIRKALDMVDQVVVSIFVNPTQFNQKEDFEQYPRNIEKDKILLQEAGVHVLFIPQHEEVFQGGMLKIKLSIPSLENTLCASSRPSHFDGVLLIVYSFLSWLTPDYAFFGLKDYQQYLYIKTMVKELYLPTSIIGVPTVRQADGLAMSSRNERLSDKARKDALIIYETFILCEKEWNQRAPIQELRELLQNRITCQKMDYCDIYSADNLQRATEPSPSKVLLAVAVWFENVRLIDNMLLTR